MTRIIQEVETVGPELTVPLEKVCFIVMKAREFDVKDPVTDPSPASNPSDDRSAAVLEDHEDDPVLEELTSLISELSVDGQVDLVALMWVGRDDRSAVDWDSVREEAALAHNKHTADYLCGTPLLADHLAEGLSVLGLSCSDYERQHLLSRTGSPGIGFDGATGCIGLWLAGIPRLLTHRGDGRCGYAL